MSSLAERGSAHLAEMEDAIIRSWLDGMDLNDPNEDSDEINIGYALEQRGFLDPAPWPYTRHQAAVGTILMEPVRERQGHRGRPYQVAGGRRDDALRRRAARSSGTRSFGVSALFSDLWKRPRRDERVRLDYASVWLPAFGRMFVTESFALHGAGLYVDYAIGHWDPDAALGRPYERVIKDHWRRQPEWLEGGREMYVNPGLVSEDEAFGWAEEVWRIEGEPLPAGGAPP